MKIQLLIAVSDSSYAEHLSNNIAENYADVIDSNVCTEAEHLREQLAVRSFDAALLDESIIESLSLESIRLPILLWESGESTSSASAGIGRIRKYQRISEMVSIILEQYAKILSDERGPNMKRANITAVWSPMGGVGKTTTALALCMEKALEGKQALYLDLEPFSSVSNYFADNGRGMSAVFEMLETGEGNIEILARSLRMQDGGSDIAYFCSPENFDDMNILTPENTAVLIEACSGVTEELVIDMSCICDERARRIFELADRVLLVTDSSRTAQIKFAQFASQNSVFPRIKSKTTLVANKGAIIGDPLVDTVIYLPAVQSADAIAVYKTLSNYIAHDARTHRSS